MGTVPFLRAPRFSGAALLGCFLVPVTWRACGRPGGRRTERRVPPGSLSSRRASGHAI